MASRLVPRRPLSDCGGRASRLVPRGRLRLWFSSPSSPNEDGEWRRRRVIRGMETERFLSLCSNAKPCAPQKPPENPGKTPGCDKRGLDRRFRRRRETAGGKGYIMATTPDMHCAVEEDQRVVSFAPAMRNEKGAKDGAFSIPRPNRSPKKSPSRSPRGSQASQERELAPMRPSRATEFISSPRSPLVSPQHPSPRPATHNHSVSVTSHDYASPRPAGCRPSPTPVSWRNVRPPTPCWDA